MEGAAWLSRVRRGIEGAAWLSRVRRGLEVAAWLSRVRRGLEDAAGLSRVRRGRPARHHPPAEPGRSQAHQNLSRLFFFSNRGRCVVGYSFGLEGAAWLSRVRRGVEGAAWLSRVRRGLESAAWRSRVRRGRPACHYAAAEPGRTPES